MPASKKPPTQRPTVQEYDLGKLSARVSAFDIGSIPLTLAKIEAQREEIKALRRELEEFREGRHLEEQPAPTTWPQS